MQYAPRGDLGLAAPGVSLSKLILDALVESYKETVHEINNDWDNL